MYQANLPSGQPDDASKKGHGTVNYVLTCMGAFVLFLVCLTPVWDSIKLLYCGTYVYFMGRMEPSLIIFFCCCIILLFIIATILTSTFARPETKTEQTFMYLFTSTICAVGLGLLFFSIPLQSHSSAAEHELMFDCTTGPRTAQLHAYYNVLLDVRQRPDCIKMQSVEDCQGYEERYPYTGFLKYLELSHSCSGFCYNAATDAGATNATLPLSAVLIQQGSEGTPGAETATTELTDALQRGTGTRKERRARRSSIALLAIDASTVEASTLESKESIPVHGGWHWGYYPSWLPHLAWPETITKTFTTKKYIQSDPAWETKNIVGYGNTVQNMQSTDWQNQYPPTLFTTANYKTTCEGAAARELRFTAADAGKMMHIEGTALFIVCVMVGFLKMMSMCKKQQDTRLEGSHSQDDVSPLSGPNVRTGPCPGKRNVPKRQTLPSLRLGENQPKDTVMYFMDTERGTGAEHYDNMNTGLSLVGSRRRQSAPVTAGPVFHDMTTPRVQDYDHKESLGGDMEHQ